MKKRMAILLAVAMLLTGCGSPSGDGSVAVPADTEPVAVRPNRLVYGTAYGFSGDLGNAWWTNDAGDRILRELINDYDTVTFDQSGTLVPNATVTKSIQAASGSDGTVTYTILLNQGLKYNNGGAITAKDYVASLLVAYSPAALEAGAQMPAFFIEGGEAYQSGEARELAGVRLIDDGTFSIRIAREYARYYYALKYASAFPLYLPMYASADLTVRDDGNGAYLAGGSLTASEVSASRFIYKGRVSAGPYQLVSLDTGSKTAVLEINPHYGGNFEGRKPSVQTLVMVKAEDGTQLEALKKGEISLLDNLSGSDEVRAALDLCETGEYGYTSFPSSGYSKLLFQCDFGPAQFIEVRQAVAYLLDRPALCQSVTDGSGSVVHGPYSSAMWMTRESQALFSEKLNPYAYDPGKAVRLLNEGGWMLDAEGNPYSGTGIRFKEVTPEEAGEYPMNVTLADGRILMPLQIRWLAPEESAVSGYLQTMLGLAAGVGMKLEQTVTAFGELLNWLYRDTGVDAGYGVPTYGMYSLTTRFTPVYDMSYSWTCDPAYVAMGLNTSRLYDPQLDRLSMDMVYGVPSGNDAAYLELWQRYIIRFNQLLPEIPLYTDQCFTVYPSWLRDYSQSAYWEFQKAVVYASIENGQ